MTATLAVGVMSGTSLDGVSTALVRLLDDPPSLDARLVAYRHEPYGAAEQTLRGEYLRRLLGRCGDDAATAARRAGVPVEAVRAAAVAPRSEGGKGR